MTSQETLTGYPSLKLRAYSLLGILLKCGFEPGGQGKRETRFCMPNFQVLLLLREKIHQGMLSPVGFRGSSTGGG